jgi:acyl carrier protein
MDDVEQQLRLFIAENFYIGEEELDRDESMTVSGIIDSTGVVEIIGYLEDTYGLAIPDEDVLPDNLDTISAIVRYVARSRTAALPR